MTLQTIVDYGAVTLAWTVTISRFPAVLKEKKRGQSTRVRKAWLLALFLSLFLTFEIDEIYVAFDRAVGVNNLSWLLSYLFGAVAIYYICVFFCKSIPRWLFLYLAVTELLFVLVFPFGPGAAEETLDHVVPANVGELVFMGLLYSYASVVLVAIPIPSCVQSLRDEETPHIRFRTVVILLALLVTVVYYVIKFGIYASSYYLPSLPTRFVNIISDLARLLGGAMAVLWPLAFASNRFYAALVRPSRLIENVLALRDLEALCARLHRLCSPTTRIPATWLDRLRNPGFFVYRSIIAILDGRQFLTDLLEHLQAGASGVAAGLPSNDSGILGGTTDVLDDRALQEAIRLDNAFRRVPLSLDLEEMVAAYRGVEQQMRRTL